MSSPLADIAGLRLTKGHGTRNDFLLFADPEGRVELDEECVRALCDRRAGVGADGVIRATRSDGRWFMDYRNADGSVAEMCGNGARVFAEFLVSQGLVDAGSALEFGTRGGVRRAWPDGLGRWSVDMGAAVFPGGEDALRAGSDVAVTFRGDPAARPGLRVQLPNPHVVVAVRSAEEVAAVDLTEPPTIDPTPTDGANVEVVAVVEGEMPTIAMRVNERGVGETASCGTGTCAAVLAVRAWAGPDAPSVWDVIVPGGTLRVDVRDHGVVLSGPAVLVGEFEVA